MADRDRTLRGLRAELRSGRTTAAALADEVIARCDALRPLNAISAFDREDYRRAAEAADRARAAGKDLPLGGLPILLKDNIDTHDLPTAAGTPGLARRKAPPDAPIVTRLRAAGALLPAKAVMHELAFGITSNNAFTGPARNPHDPSRIPGGSSGGCAVAVASGQFPAAIGTDTGASVRLPAALCGIWGFRPTLGRYPTAGIVPISSSRDTPGTLARTLGDVRLIDDVLTGRDPDADRTPSSRPLRLGLPRDAFWRDLDPEVAALAEPFLDRVSASGVVLVPVDLAGLLALNAEVSFPVALFEVMRDLPAYLRDSGAGVTLDDIIAGIASPDVRAIFAQVQAAPVPPAVYQKVMTVTRPALIAAHRRLFRDHDLDALVFPTSPMLARPIGQDETVRLNGREVPTFATYTAHVDLCSNVAGPGISMPIGLGGGLPVGLELDGLPGRDEALLDLAARIAPLLPEMPVPGAAAAFTAG